MRFDTKRTLSNKVIDAVAKQDFTRLDNLSPTKELWSIKKGDNLTLRKVVNEIKTTQGDKVILDVKTRYELIAINGKNISDEGNKIIPNNLIEGDSSKMSTFLILGLLALGFLAYKQFKK